MKDDHRYNHNDTNDCLKAVKLFFIFTGGKISLSVSPWEVLSVKSNIFGYVKQGTYPQAIDKTRKTFKG